MEKIIVTRTLLKAGIVNKNGYMYDQAALESIHGQLDHYIKNDLAFGYFANNNDALTIPLGEVSHRVIESNFDGEKIDIDIQVLDTPKGQLLAELLQRDETSVSFRPRGTGIINGEKVVTEYQLSSINVVPRQDDLYEGLL